MNRIDEFQEKAMQTAYCWTRYKYYGSESRAVSSLLNRRGIEGFSREEAARAIKSGIEILKETDIAWKAVRRRENRSMDQLREEEIHSLANEITELLAKRFPNSCKGTFDYAVGMIVLMPYYR